MRIILIFLLLPIKLFSQDIAGVWTGTIYNDSTRKYIPYEIAITENKGKLSGFSHTIFTGENNVQETGVKSLKIKKKSDRILIEDDELIYNNYTDPPPKGVKQFSVLNITSGTSGEYLVGAFNTNRTKEYASVTGTIKLQKKNKIEETKLIPKLDELKLSSSLSFIQNKPKEKEAVTVVSEPPKKVHPFQIKQKQKDVAVKELPKTQPMITEDDEKKSLSFKEDTVEYKVDVIETEDMAKGKKQKPEAIKTPQLAINKTDKPLQKEKQLVKNSETKTPPADQTKKDVIIPSPDEKKTKTIVQPKEKATTLVPKILNKPDVSSQTKKENNNQNTSLKKSQTVIVPKEKNKEPIIIPVSKPLQNPSIVTEPIVSSEELAKRKIETIRTVDFKSDSLVLTLYDNGVVDGDTVTIILNGKVIMSKQGLSTKAITKTIYTTPELGDSLQLIMYAENLGSIPPNTGLLIIQDGEDRYQIRFAGDLQKNSAIILQRKHQR